MGLRRLSVKRTMMVNCPVDKLPLHYAALSSLLGIITSTYYHLNQRMRWGRAHICGSLHKDKDLWKGIILVQA